MKERILYGWNIRRVLYTLIGSIVIIQSVIQHQWWGIFLGGYFAAMGIFRFGCASGECFTGSCDYKPNLKNTPVKIKDSPSGEPEIK